MQSNEEKIKDFARKAGIGLVGIAGEGRFDGPPSLDPTYTLKGARAIVSMALPMNVPAIYDFLSKKSRGPHNLEQLKSCQRMHRISKELADYIVELGYKALPVPPNNTYRRSPDPFTPQPSFSHRFGAVVAGLGTFGLSGNVVTRQYGAAVYLGTVITDAPLKSDPILPARDTMDNRCRTCKLCDKSCTLRMFRDDEEEYLLINGELHARGKRDNLDLCNMPCFGLHGISSDKKWTNWGRHWIREYSDHRPDPENRTSIRMMMMREGPRSGDGGPRYDVIRRGNSILYPRQSVEDMIPDYESLPGSEEEISRLLVTAHEHMGVTGLKDPYVLTCGQCSLVCGPDFDETKKRYDMLIASGYVVPGVDSRMVRVNTYERARELKSRYHVTVSRRERLKNSGGTFWLKNYFGFEPKGVWQNWLYLRKAKKACAEAGLADKEAKAPTLFLGVLGRSHRKKGQK
ncbi:MAG: hypothetical protein NTV42_09900 [Chloroflexi bacterium]|nr:hypothetical protein [Chloroflexota bacterium]